MDKKTLLQPEIQAFIKAHEEDDLRLLMLQKKKYQNLPLVDIVDQISARKKAKTKLPTWYKSKDILYPPLVSIEQSSSEVTAKYKASLFSGKSAVDLTGGFGVDSFFLAQNFSRFEYVEKNEILAQIAQHNFLCLKQQNIKTNILSAENYLSHSSKKHELIYIDPDRRPNSKRVKGFGESKPSLSALLPQLHNLSTNILVKASPMMDITLGIKQLNKVKMVIVMAVEGEVKELLFWLTNQNNDIKISCVNITKEGEDVFEYFRNEEQQEYCDHKIISNYLYEPNAAIMKAGAYNLLCKRFNIKKLHPNTHLYTSDIELDNFPGRGFRVIDDVQYKKQKTSPLLTSLKANISVRNFPDTPEQVKKKLGVKDGGAQYLFGYRNINNDSRIAVCEKI